MTFCSPKTFKTLKVDTLLTFNVLSMDIKSLWYISFNGHLDVFGPHITEGGFNEHLISVQSLNGVVQGFSKSAFKGPNLNLHQCQRNNWLLQNLFLINIQ